MVMVRLVDACPNETAAPPIEKQHPSLLRRVPLLFKRTFPARSLHLSPVKAPHGAPLISPPLRNHQTSRWVPHRVHLPGPSKWSGTISPFALEGRSYRSG